jgi:hypothetical protein
MQSYVLSLLDRHARGEGRSVKAAVPQRLVGRRGDDGAHIPETDRCDSDIAHLSGVDHPDKPTMSRELLVPSNTVARVCT